MATLFDVANPVVNAIDEDLKNIGAAFVTNKTNIVKKIGQILNTTLNGAATTVDYTPAAAYNLVNDLINKT